MSEQNKRPTGWTRNSGFQIGVRRTLPVGLEQAWQLVTSPPGLKLWLGSAGGFQLEKGVRFQLEDGSQGEVRVFSPDSHLRLTWDPGGWPRSSTIQVRVIPKGERTTIAFHQEHLPDAQARERRRAYFKAALSGLEELIEAGRHEN